MINIITRGGIHRTKHEFGPFNRKYKPKRNKKRALIVHRGVYSEHAFSCGTMPARSRGMKNLSRHPFLARQGLKRAAWKWRSLGRLIGEQVHEQSQRKGFVRQFLEVKPEGQLFSPEDFMKATEGPVPHFEVDFVDEKFCFLDIVEPETILKLHTDIVSRMPFGLIPQNGDFLSFDPDDPEGETGSRVRMHNGKIVEVQRQPTKWHGPYKMLEKTDEVRKGWNVWRATPMFKTLREARTISGVASEPLKAGEAVVINKDGTFSPFRGMSISMHPGALNEDLAQSLQVMFEVPEALLNPEPRHKSMGFVAPDGFLSGDATYDTSEWQMPPMMSTSGRTITRINDNTNLITDSYRETVNESDTEEEVNMTDKKRDILHIVIDDSDGWNPTEDEMRQLSELFQDVLEDEKGGIIVTRSGVTATVLSVSEGCEVKVTKAQVTQDDMAKRIDSTVSETEKPAPRDDIESTLADLTAEDKKEGK